jgi:16S rRNA (adenine1518-N6/adenine1519-N6)-dimethyltransferase
MAQPGTKDYGALAVLVQSLTEVQLIRKLAPSVFFPRPEVHSAIICVLPDPTKRAKVGDVLAFRYFLRDLYTHRRKNLRSALSSMPAGQLAKKNVDEKLQRLNFDGNVRAEQLSVDDHLHLFWEFGVTDSL